MKTLQRRIFRNFIVCILLIILLLAIANDFFYLIIEPLVEKPFQFFLFAAGSFLTDVLIVGLGTYVFWLWTKQSFESANRERLEEQNLLYASIVHDIKTPMTSIKGYASALLDGKVESEKDAHEIILRKSNQVNSLLDDLFDYTKMSAGATQSEQTRQNVVELVREVLADSYDLIDKQEVILSIKLPENPVYGIVSARDFKRLLSNLVGNAIQHNAPKTKIEVKLEPSSDKMTIFVADDGELISSDAIDKIFDPFVRQGEARTSGGSGLGLAIAEKIATSYEGNITITDNYPGYTKAFVVVIPRTAEQNF